MKWARALCDQCLSNTHTQSMLRLAYVHFIYRDCVNELPSRESRRFFLLVCKFGSVVIWCRFTGFVAIVTITFKLDESGKQRGVQKLPPK